MSGQPSAGLLMQQAGVVSAFVLGAAQSVLPKRGRGIDHSAIQQQRKPPSLALQRAYAQWSRAKPGRYEGIIPWTLVNSQIALPMISALTARSPYPLLSVLNQGIRLRLHQPLPATAELCLSGRLVEASDDGYRARIHSRVTVGTAAQAEAVTLDAYAAVVLAKKSHATPPVEKETAFVTIDRWQAAADEGRRFFYLTGDFNPIHTLPVFARRTRFRGCIMHGYGGFAQLFEALQNAGWAVAEIDIKFIRPLPLPSPELLIQLAAQPDADGRIAVRMIDTAGQLYHVGRFTPRS